MTHDQELQFRISLAALLPITKRYARSLLSITHDYHSLHEDFAQEAMLKAWEHRDHFIPGTNLKAWVFTILRNAIVSHHRRCWREVFSDRAADPEMSDETTNPENAVAAREFLGSLELLKKEHREVLTDLGWDGLSYSQAAKRRNVALGTIRSRAARARERLAGLTGGSVLHYGRRMATQSAE